MAFDAISFVNFYYLKYSERWYKINSSRWKNTCILLHQMAEMHIDGICRFLEHFQFEIKLEAFLILLMKESTGCWNVRTTPYVNTCIEQPIKRHAILYRRCQTIHQNHDNWQKSQVPLLSVMSAHNISMHFQLDWNIFERSFINIICNA